MKKSSMVWVAVLFVTAACGGGTVLDVPEVEPPVRAATPEALRSGSASGQSMSARFALSPDDIKSRFFSPGPTEISFLLKMLDDRMAELENRSAETARPCLDEPPVAVEMEMLGDAVTAWFQCYEILEPDGGGLLFGQNEGVWYLFENGGQARQLARVEPNEDGGFRIDAFITVGQANAESSNCENRYDGCSYGAVRLRADSSTNAFELSTAGVPNGWGFCSAHLKSDGTALYSVGQSVAAGPGGGCAPLETQCALATDLTAEGSCAEIDDDNFELPVLGTEGELDLDAARVDVALRFTGEDAQSGDPDDVHYGLEPSAFSEIEGLTAF